MIVHGTFYYYHPDGHYDDGDERYDKVTNINDSWDDTLTYVNCCRNNSSPKKPPLNPTKVVLFKAGIPKLIIKN